MSQITITLPDGSRQQVPHGTKPLDIARSISPRLADDAVVARIDGALHDLTRPLEADAKVEILTSKNPESLEVYRHSTAHLLAVAVLELFPETKLGVGPPTETGFYWIGKSRDLRYLKPVRAPAFRFGRDRPPSPVTATAELRPSNVCWSGMVKPAPGSFWPERPAGKPGARWVKPSWPPACRRPRQPQHARIRARGCARRAASG